MKKAQGDLTMDRNKILVARKLVGIAKEIMTDELNGKWKKLDISKMDASKLSEILYAINSTKEVDKAIVEVDGKKYKCVSEGNLCFSLCEYVG